MSKPLRLRIACGSAKLSFVVGTFQDVLSLLLSGRQKSGQIVLPCPLYDLARVESDPQIAAVYSKVDACTTDGVPLVWWFRQRTHHPEIERVYGPDILAEVLRRTPKKRHYFLCPNQEVIDRLRLKFNRQVRQKLIHLELVGNSKDPVERKRLVRIIRKTKPRFVWIGVGSPNQVLLATFLKEALKIPCTYWCVGAAIPFLAGTVVQAPRWMQHNGLEWLFRLGAEPGRLWKRYLVDTPLFLFRLLFARIRNNHS